MTEPLVEARNLARTFGHAATLTHAVRDVSLELYAGQMTLVMGPSGCGKSTLMAMLAGLLHPTAGQIRAHGQDLYKMPDRQRREYRLRYVGSIFQGFHLFPTLTVREQLEMVLHWGEGGSGQEIARRVGEMLEMLDISSRAHVLPRHLSGGEKQRVAIGRALIKFPALCFADEPTSALDWEHGKSIVEFLRRMADERDAMVLVVTHDPRVLPFADRVLYLEDGRMKDQQVLTPASRLGTIP